MRYFARIKRHVRLAVVLSLLPLSALGCPDADAGLVKLGEGKLRVFGFSIYTASLWSRPDASLQEIYSQPVLLMLDYSRNVSREKILRSTAEEWKRVNMPYPELEAEWLESLANILPNVKAGDRLATRVSPNGETCFYMEGEEIGRVTDAKFGPAFLSIWLDRETRSRSLRAALLNDLRAQQ